MNRCFVVSNRLPLTFDKKSNQFLPSSGGLVSAIKGIDPDQISYDFEWIGLTTDELSLDKFKDLQNLYLGKIKINPLRVNKNEYDLFYNEYSNNVLWPLFHYEQSLVVQGQKSWEAYNSINSIVSNYILSIADESDLIWIHDFHFFLVPGLIKGINPNLKIGFFLHIPFPSSEIFRELPQREEILGSLIKADLVGFHDLSYVNHFKNCVLRILGKNLDHISDKKNGVYPISVDTNHFFEISKSEKTKSFLNEYLRIKKDSFWVLGIDRLDYIKGLDLKLKTFKEFLTSHPEWVGKIQFLQLVIPSRTDVKDYQELKKEIEQLIANINGEFGTAAYTPVVYLYKSVNEFDLSALYQASDLLYVGSSRDGMNLVCLEYVVSQQAGKEGQVLLSEFAGAHSTLSHVFSINPWDIKDTCYKILLALSASKESKNFKNNQMKNFLTQYTSSTWALSFINDLSKIERENLEIIQIDGRDLKLESKNLRTKKALIFCDLDGTLLPIMPHPTDVFLDKKTITLLRNLQGNANLEFVIISGREHSFFQKEFIENQLFFTVAACHGSVFFDKSLRQWIDKGKDLNQEWKHELKNILKIYANRTPNSFIEEKEHAIVWHFRNSPSGFAEDQSLKLLSELEKTFSTLPISITKGKKIIEVKSHLANKGLFVKNFISSLPFNQLPDFILSFGDDSTDEDMFKVLKDQQLYPSISFKVGNENTVADFRLKSQSDVGFILEKFSH